MDIVARPAITLIVASARIAPLPVFSTFQLSSEQFNHLNFCSLRFGQLLNVTVLIAKFLFLVVVRVEMVDGLPSVALGAFQRTHRSEGGAASFAFMLFLLLDNDRLFVQLLLWLVSRVQKQVGPYSLVVCAITPPSLHV